MSRLNDRLNQTAAWVEEALKKLYADHGEPQQTLYDAMSYSLLAGGKRLRPFLAREFCAACGADPSVANPAALSIEMIHTYSLIHDDLPCMDNDDYRRGKLTNHKVFGEAMAVLAADGLQTDAFRVLAQSDLPAETVVQCVSLLSCSAGPWGMVGGQVLDMESETRACTDREVLDIQTRKTGGLFRAACGMGVLCGGGSPAQLQAALQYADALGLAFQIRDDILDVCGDAAKLGKAVGVDANKNTFVRLYGIDRCEQLIKQKTEEAISALSDFESPELLQDLALALSNRDR